MTNNRLPDSWFPELTPTEDAQANQQRGRIEHTLATARRQGKIDDLSEYGWRTRLQANFHQAAAELGKEKPRYSGSIR